MRTRDILLIIVIIIIGLSIEGGLKLKDKALPFFMGLEFGGKANYFQDTATTAFNKGGIIEIENSHGDITFVPSEKEEMKVELEKVIYTNDEKKAKEISAQITVKLEQKDKTTLVSTNRDELDFKAVNVKTNLKIYVPREASSSIKIDHGSLSLSGMEGNFTIDSKHSEAEIKDIAGNVTWSSAHDDIQIESIIGGTVNVRAEHGDGQFLNIDGNLNIAMEDETVSITDARKNVVLKAKQSEVTAQEIAANFEVDAEHTEIHAENIQGNAIIKSSYKDIEVANVKGTLKLTAEHSDVNAQNLFSNADINTQYGTVTFGIPEKMSFSVDFTADNGDIQSDFEQLQSSQEKLISKMTGKIGEGGPRYLIKTTYNDINLNKLSDNE